MVFDFHARIAGDKPVWVEKTAIDVFHLETLEWLLSGHARFILLTRNPLDVIVSNLRLQEVMGAQLSDLFELTTNINGPYEGIARAWVDRAQAMRAFAKRQPTDTVLHLRYEDLTRDLDTALTRIFDFLAVEPKVAEVVDTAFTRAPRIGLGDFNVDATTGIRPSAESGWRGKIPRAALARIVSILADEMTAAGYTVPKVADQPSREEAVRHFQMSTALKRDRSRQASES
jgi:hypothetical protein